MIRTCLSLLLLSVILADVSVQDYKRFDYGELQLDKVDRMINLNGAYPEETIKVVVRNRGNNPTKTFYHVVSNNVSRNTVDIKFVGSNDLKYSVIETADGYTIYKVDLNEAILRTEVTLTITSRFINRYRNFPKTIEMTGDQLLEYSDFKHYFTPYKVNQQAATYKFQKITSATPEPTSTQFTSVKYSEANLIAPFSREGVVVHGQNNVPQMVFTEVTKTLEISHWGNIAISEKYSIINKGPGLKGEFSRVQYNPYNEKAGKNTFRKTVATLPYETWGLYYRDQVGNISTSRAFRDSSSKNVRLQIVPRFGIFGGWKSNWEIGYNLPTENNLLHNGDHFELSQLTLGYELDRIVTEKFIFTVILPEGAANIKLNINGQDVKYTTGVDFSFLDFVGRPTITFEKGASGKDIQNNFKLTYDYTSKSLLKKPFLVFVTLFSIFVLIIITGRLELKTLHIDKY